MKAKRLTATKGHREIQNYKRDFYVQHRLSSHWSFFFFFFFQPAQEAQPSTKTQKKKKNKFLRSTDSREIFFTFFSINDFLERDEFMIDVRINRYVFVQRTRPNRRQTLENAKNVPNC